MQQSNSSVNYWLMPMDLPWWKQKYRNTKDDYCFGSSTETQKEWGWNSEFQHPLCEQRQKVRMLSRERRTDCTRIFGVCQKSHRLFLLAHFNFSFLCQQLLTNWSHLWNSTSRPIKSSGAMSPWRCCHTHGERGGQSRWRVGRVFLFCCRVLLCCDVGSLAEYCNVISTSRKLQNSKIAPA